MPLGHAAVVDHEEVDLELVGAGAGDGVVLRPYELHHLHAAALALLGGRHRGLTEHPVYRQHPVLASPPWGMSSSRGRGTAGHPRSYTRNSRLCSQLQVTNI